MVKIAFEAYGLLLLQYKDKFNVAYSANKKRVLENYNAIHIFCTSSSLNDLKEDIKSLIESTTFNMNNKELWINCSKLVEDFKAKLEYREAIIYPEDLIAL